MNTQTDKKQPTLQIIFETIILDIVVEILPAALFIKRLVFPI